MLGGLLLLAACTGGGSADETTASPTTPATSQARQCEGADLTADAGDVDGLTGGTGILRLRLRNVSASPCSVSGPAAVVLLDAARKPLPQPEADLDGAFGDESLVVLAPGAPPGAFIPVSVSGLTDAGVPCATRHPAWRSGASP